MVEGVKQLVMSKLLALVVGNYIFAKRPTMARWMASPDGKTQRRADGRHLYAALEKEGWKGVPAPPPVKRTRAKGKGYYFTDHGHRDY